MLVEHADLEVEDVSPITVNRKWPGSMIPAWTGPTGTWIHTLARNFTERVFFVRNY